MLTMECGRMRRFAEQVADTIDEAGIEGLSDTMTTIWHESADFRRMVESIQVERKFPNLCYSHVAASSSNEG